jgi:uncharacterized membrane protein YjjP (DUF1212 family)
MSDLRRGLEGGLVEAMLHSFWFWYVLWNLWSAFIVYLISSKEYRTLHIVLSLFCGFFGMYYAFRYYLLKSFVSYDNSSVIACAFLLLIWAVGTVVMVYFWKANLMRAI